MKNHLLPRLSSCCGARLQALAVAGVCALGLAQPAAAQTPLFKFWSLKTGAQDSAELRMPANLPASSATLRKFVLSNGTAATPTTPKPFSSQYGMAFAPAADGGGWSTAAGGTGGLLRRYYYVQLTATAPAGTPLRADSLVMNLSFVNSTSNTYLGVAYSKNGFGAGLLADSTEVSGGGKGPKGALTGVVNPTAGSTSQFNNAFFLEPSLSALTATGPNLPNTNKYSIALNGATGVTLAAGQTLTVRIYVSCSSSSAGRYALLRNVALKSTQVALASTKGRVIKNGLTLAPNPAFDQVQVNHPLAKAGAQVSVYTATGQRVAQLRAQTGTATTALDLRKLAAGLYLVEYADGAQRVTARIVKQ
jgi:hypothetical protein